VAGQNINFTPSDTTLKIDVPDTVSYSDSSGLVAGDNAVTWADLATTTQDSIQRGEQAYDSVTAWDNGILLWADGSVPLTANWAAGDFDITGVEAIESDSGTFTVELTIRDLQLNVNGTLANYDSTDQATDGQQLTWNTGNTLTWEPAGAGSGNTFKIDISGTTTNDTLELGQSATISFTLDQTSDPDSAYATIQSSSLTQSLIDMSEGQGDNPAYPAYGIWFGDNGLLFEGTTADDAEGMLYCANPTSDRAWQLQDATGTIYQTGGFDVNIAEGGTGVSILEDGGIMLGSGADPVTVMSVLGDGHVVIGDNVTDPVTIQAFTAYNGFLRHEVGGLEADVNGYTGLVGISGGSVSEVDASSEVASMLDDESGAGLVVFNDNPSIDTLTVTSMLTAESLNVSDNLKIPSSDDPTTNASGEFAWDTDGALEVYLTGESESALMPVFKHLSVPIVQPDSVQAYSPDLHILTLNSLVYPFGIEIDSISIQLDADAAYSMVIEEWSGADPPVYQNAISTVTTGATDTYAIEAPDTDGNLDAGDKIYLDIPTTDVPKVTVEIYYHVTEGN
jgi:hypothetical protein